MAADANESSLRTRHALQLQACRDHVEPMPSGAWCLQGHKSKHKSIWVRLYNNQTHNIRTFLLPGGHKRADVAVVNFLLALKNSSSWTLRPTVNDFGAGVGQYGHALLNADQAFGYLGYDGAADVEQFTNGFIRWFDLTSPLSLPKADWVLSLEVGEHIPSSLEAVMIRNLHVHNCLGIILSWASPGQVGDWHINTHRQTYLLDVFRELGYHLNDPCTKHLRASSRTPWLKKNLMVLERNEAACGAPTDQRASLHCGLNARGGGRSVTVRPAPISSATAGMLNAPSTREHVFSNTEQLDTRLLVTKQLNLGATSCLGHKNGHTASNEIDMVILILTSYSAARSEALRSWTQHKFVDDACSVLPVFVSGTEEDQMKLHHQQNSVTNRSILMLKIPWVDANTSNIWHLVTGAMAWLHSVRTLPFRYVVKTDDDALVCPNNLILAIRGATERLEKLPPLHFLGEPYFVLTPSTNMTSSTRPIGMHYPLGALYALSRSLLSKIAPALQLDGAGRYNRGCDFAENKEDFCIGLLVCRIGTGNSQRLHSLEEIPQALNFSGKGPCLSKRRGVLFTSLVSQMRQRKMSFPRYQSTDDRRLATTCADTNFIVFHRLRDNEVFKECLRQKDLGSGP